MVNEGFGRQEDRFLPGMHGKTEPETVLHKVKKVKKDKKKKKFDCVKKKGESVEDRKYPRKVTIRFRRVWV